MGVARATEKLSETGVGTLWLEETGERNPYQIDKLAIFNESTIDMGIKESMGIIVAELKKMVFQAEETAGTKERQDG